jgi:hypothetical protein
MAATIITLRRPIISERMPAGMLTRIPTTVEAAAMNPTVETGTPIERMNKGRAGFLAMVELKIARPPMIHSIKKGEIRLFILVSW